MPRMENPEMTVPGGSVFVIYPGANPADMEQLITIPIEEAVNELEDLKKIETGIRDGMAVISVEFEFSTNGKDKYDELVQKVNSVRSKLPNDIYSLETMQWKSSDVAMLQLALVAEEAEYFEMEQKAEDLKAELNKLSGVRKVELHAFPEQEVRISLDMEKMAQMNITIDHVANAIRSNNANIPGGSIVLGDKSFGIKTSGSYNNLQEIRNTVVNSYMGRIIYLKNIASVDYKYQDDKYIARYNGQKSIFITVKQKEGLNIFKINDKITPVIEDFIAELDDGFEMYYVFNQAIEVDKKINGFISNLLQGIALVGLVILLALGFKSALIVIIAIPLSNLIGIAFVDIAGFGLEQISIAGLVVALGLLVDNSIVVIENINRFIRLGRSPKEAAIEGTREIGWPVVSATITTLLAFVPIITMPDKAGKFIRSMPITIFATLSVSLLIALSLTPLIASRTLKASRNADKPKRSISNLLRGFIEGPYRKTLNFGLRYKWLIILLAILLLGGSGYFLNYVGFSLFPKAEKPQFIIRIHTPDGTNLEKTDEVTRFVESILDTTSQVDYYASNIGHGNPRIYYNVISTSYAKNFADIFVHLKKYDYREFNYLVDTLRTIFSHYAGAKINIKEFEQGVPVTAPIMVYIMGNDLNVLKDITKEVEEMIQDAPGVINVDNRLAKQRTDIYFDINKEKAGIFGVPVYEIDKTIRTAINGSSVSKYRDKEGQEYDIVLRLPFEKKINIEDFDKIYVKSHTGRLIPVSQLTTIEFRIAPGIINKYNLSRSGLITADLVKGASFDEAINPVIKQLETYNLPQNYSYYIGGEMENRKEAFGGMFVAGLIAFISIFSVLVLQFRSFLQPFIIIIAIPFALIGAIWALMITGHSFSFTALIGIISLLGIVINNSIILVDYTNKLIEKGVNMRSAISQAGETRFTPIILTTLTTIGGLLPLTLRGGTLWAPMGWTIIGGLLVSTILTLIVVPVFYSLLSIETLHRLKENHNRIKDQVRNGN